MFYKYTATLVFLFCSPLAAQSNLWQPQYATLDDALNGTGYKTASVAVIGPDRFVALVSAIPDTAFYIFNTTVNYLVGYWDADSLNGRVTQQKYEPSLQKEIWQNGRQSISFNGAWQITAGPKERIYVANNDSNHTIIVYSLTEQGVKPLNYRIATGDEDIYAIAVNRNGYVFVADFLANASKKDELKIYQPIDWDTGAWQAGAGERAAPLTSIDLPPGRYQGLAVNRDGSEIYIANSADSERRIIKFTGNWRSGYQQDSNFNFALAADDIVGDGGSGRPTFLGLAYADQMSLLFAATDVFLSPGITGAYSYGRIYVFDSIDESVIDTIDIAANNLARVGEYMHGSANGLAGGYASVYDVEIDEELSVYTQSYYGWAVEKWDYPVDITTTAVDELEKLFGNFELSQNYPNPFHRRTNIPFCIAGAGHVKIEIYSVRGERIALLVDENMMPGRHLIIFDAAHLPSGCYLYTIKFRSFQKTKKCCCCIKL